MGFFGLYLMMKNIDLDVHLTICSSYESHAPGSASLLHARFSASSNFLEVSVIQDNSYDGVWVITFSGEAAHVMQLTCDSFGAVGNEKGWPPSKRCMPSFNHMVTTTRPYPPPPAPPPAVLHSLTSSTLRIRHYINLRSPTTPVCLIINHWIQARPSCRAHARIFTTTMIFLVPHADAGGGEQREESTCQQKTALYLM